MSNGEEFVHEVDVERITTASATVLVRAKDQAEAIEKAREVSKRTFFETQSVHYKPHNPRVKTDLELPPPSPEAGYRDFVWACCNDGDYNLRLLPTFEDWKEEHLIQKLVEFAETYGVEPEQLDETIHDFKSGEASSINNSGLRGQIEFLLEGENYTAVRQRLVALVSDDESWPKEDEEDDIDSDED